jgi:anti-sigma factor RsiW
MNCHDVQRSLHPYSDGELDLVRQVEIEQHLAGCAACAEQEQHLQSLRTAVSSPSLYHRAPAGLLTRIQRALPPGRRVPQRTSGRLLAIAAGVLLLIGASATMGYLLHRPASPVSQGDLTAEDRLAESVVAGHVRSLRLEGKHLTDEPSSDKHTVKPWFQGKLDFIPQVPDISQQGYKLAGGRLDYLIDRPVAALVYFRGSHAINLFIWSAGNAEAKAVQELTRQGFHLRSWQASGFTYWAISDVNEQDLEEFVRLIQENS